MKKLIVIMLIICLVLVLAGCNKNPLPGHYSFTGVHISDSSGNARDLTVTSWRDDAVGIELNTKEAGPIFCSEGTYILYEDQCPICSGKENN